MKFLVKNIFVIVLVVLSVFLFVCLINQKNKQNHNSSDNILVFVKNMPIYKDELDSLLDERLYQLKMQGLEQLIEHKIFKLESKKRNISVNQLIGIEIADKCILYKNNTKKGFINKYDLNIKNIENKNVSYLESACRTKRKNEYLDSLKNYYEFTIKMKPKKFRTINTDNIYAYNLTTYNPEKLDVYILSDFNCPSCQQIAPELEKLIQYYKEKANFKFVPYSDYYGKAALICELAARQNKFKEMYKVLVKNSKKLHNDSVFFEFVKELNLSIDQYKECRQNKGFLKLLLKNKAVFQEYNIFTTPSFIINNKILDGKYAKYYLEDVIQDEIQSFESNE
jgi:predicted DsbA family dithiol-disulfide isomerase